MSKYPIKELWNEIYGKQEKVYDYTGRLMLKSACGNPNSSYQPTIDHIRPISNGGKDKKCNIVICHSQTNEEKCSHFPHWKANGLRFYAKKRKNIPGGYEIIQER